MSRTPATSSSQRHSPAKKRPATSSGGSTTPTEGWWEHVLPEGQLAERLRRAHSLNQTSPGRSRTDVKTMPSSPIWTAGSKSAMGNAEDRRQTVRAALQHRPSNQVSASPSSSKSTSKISFPASKKEDAKQSSRVNDTYLAVPQPRSGHRQQHRSSRSRVEEPRDMPEQLHGTVEHVPQQRMRVHSADQAVGSGASSSSSSLSSSSSSRKGKNVVEPLSTVNHSSSSHDSELAKWRHSIAEHHVRDPPHTTRSAVLRHQALSTGRCSPLSRTPDISSGSEDETDRDRLRGDTLSEGAAPSSLSSRKTHGSISQTSSISPPSLHSSSMSDVGWSESSYGHSSRSHRPHSRRVSFDVATTFIPGSTSTQSLDGHHPPDGGLNITYQPHDDHGAPMRRVPSAAESLAASGSQHWFNTTSSSSGSRRRTRTLTRDTFAMQAGHFPRVTASAPTSPRASFLLSDAERVRLSQSLASRKASRPPIAARSLSDRPAATENLSVSRPLGGAQDHLFKKTSGALEYSRSLLARPAPVLKPLLHLTLLWCVSSATLMVLAGCLMLSYMLTAWDDVGGKGREVRKHAWDWGKWLGVAPSAPQQGRQRSDSSESDASTDAAPSEASRRSSLASSVASEAGKLVIDSLIISPIHIATKLPIAVAKSFTPSAVPSRRHSTAQTDSQNKSKGADQTDGSPILNEDDSIHRSPEGAGHSNGRKPRSRPQPLPPRPPLFSLLTSMVLTIFIAIGAGLVGGWAKRRGDVPPHVPETQHLDGHQSPTSPLGSPAFEAAQLIDDHYPRQKTYPVDGPTPPSTSSPAAATAAFGGLAISAAYAKQQQQQQQQRKRRNQSQSESESDEEDEDEDEDEGEDGEIEELTRGETTL